MPSARACRWIVAGCALITFLPTVRLHFVNLDDFDYLVDNVAVHDPAGLTTIWTTFQMPANSTNWPLVFTSFWCEYRVWGLNPAGYHLTNTVLHSAAALLLFSFLHRVGVGLWTSWLAAMLFAVHPIQVESVAWVTERKNVLSGVFFFASLWTYARSRSEGGWGQAVASLVLFAAGLLSKSSVVILPVVLVSTDRLLLGERSIRSSLRRAAPYFALALLASLATIAADRISPRNVPLIHRPFIASTALWFYLGKLAYPATFVPVYPRWRIDPADGLWWLSLASVASIAALAIGYRRRIDKVITWGMAYYVVALAPVLGIVTFGFLQFTFVADHFAYLACVGPFVVAGRAIELLDRLERPRLMQWVRRGAWLAVAFLALQSMIQTGVWTDTRTLWEHGNEYSPAGSHDVLATAAFHRGKYAEAAQHLREVVCDRPDDAYAVTSLGQCLFRSGNTDEGMHYLKQAAAMDPGHFDVQCNLGNALLLQDRPGEAATSFQRAVRLQPRSATAHVLWGTALLKAGQIEKARSTFTRALELDPRSAEARSGYERASRRATP